MKTPKAKTLFNLIDDITINKIKWDDQSDVDKRTFSPFMTNRCLSMDDDLLELIAECQCLTESLSPKEFYNFYLDLLPKKKLWNKYIKSKAEKDRPKLVDFISIELSVSRREAQSYIEMLMSDPQTYMELSEWVKGHGYTDKELKKEFAI